MRKLFKGQRILSVLYILASIGMFLFALAFMTEYSDLFGLKLPQNQEIAMFHDVILQTFNRQIFAWSLVGVIGIALIVFLEILSCVPDRFALVVMLLLMVACCYGAANSIMNYKQFLFTIRDWIFSTCLWRGLKTISCGLRHSGLEWCLTHFTSWCAAHWRSI